MVIVDCKAVPANVVDSELFGHVKGAFPGAFAEKSGRMLEADMGSLVLDEIAALPHSTQETLDRVLATGEVRPVGCNGSSSIDIRLIATSSMPLPESFNQLLGERISRHDRQPSAASRPQRRHSDACAAPASALRGAGADPALVDRQ